MKSLDKLLGKNIKNNRQTGIVQVYIKYDKLILYC